MEAVVSSDGAPAARSEWEEKGIDRFLEVGNAVADAAGEVTRKYFRKSFDVLDKEDRSHVTIADREAAEAMVSIISRNLPSHAIYLASLISLF